MKYKRFLIPLVILLPVLLSDCQAKENTSNGTENVRSYCIDFNWGEGGPNQFAAPGLWADADPKEHIRWYKSLGVNTVQTFIVSCNGYAWYKNGVVEPQPGLKHDFLPEMVRLGHKEGLKVMGYLCAGSNTRWGKENPAYSYGIPATRHIPYTDKYLAYLDEVIRDAIKKTGIDGFMVDWLFQPSRKANRGKWLESEKKLYEQLMGDPFPGRDNLSREAYTEYSRRALDRCWDVIHTAAKETDPNTTIWLSTFDINHPHTRHSTMYEELDWLMNEEGDLQKIDSVRNMVGSHTQLITCLAKWNQKDARSTVIRAQEAGVGLYGFTRPKEGSLLPPVDYYLSHPIDSLEGDNKNIATFARVYNGLPLDHVSH